MKNPLLASRSHLLNTPPSDGPATPSTPEEFEALERLQTGWSLGLIDVNPWVQPVDSDVLGVSWLTASPAVGAVEWTQDPAPDDTARWHRATDSDDSLVLANTTAQRALLRGWNPALALRFRLIVRPVTAFQRNRVTMGPEEHSALFHIDPLTGDSGATSFVVFNDVHSHPQNFPLLWDAAGADARFAVFNGDIVQNPMTLSEVTENLLLPMAWFTAQGKPVLYVRGNHETRGAYTHSLKQHLALPNRHTYGALTLGAARIVFLDGGTGEKDEWLYASETFIDEQCAWLEREVASPAYQNTRWRLVIVHEPPLLRTLGLERMECDRFVNQRFTPILDRLPPHAVLAGHTHTPERIDPAPNADRFRFPVFVGGAADLGRATALRVDLDANTLTLALFRVDGSILTTQTWHHS